MSQKDIENVVISNARWGNLDNTVLLVYTIGLRVNKFIGVKNNCFDR